MLLPAGVPPPPRSVHTRHSLGKNGLRACSSLGYNNVSVTGCLPANGLVKGLPSVRSAAAGKGPTWSYMALSPAGQEGGT